MRNKIFGLAVLLPTLLLCMATSRALAKEQWARINTINFTLVSDAGEGEMKRVATQLELFRAILAQLLPRAKVSSPVPTTILLFRNHDSFRPFKPKHKGKTRDEVGGYFLARWDVNYIALTADKRGISPFEVIFHEYVHFIVNNHLTDAPLWLNEGLAEYYSTFTMFDNEEKMRIGGPIGRHILTLRNNRLLPLNILLAVDAKSPHYTEATKVGIFYAQSWALVHYLLHGKEGKRQAQFVNFIAQLTSGKSLNESFQQAFETDYKTIEDELRQYISRFLFTALEGRIPPTLVNQFRNIKGEALTEAEAQYYLGDLLLHGNRLDEAATRLEKAHQLDAKFVPGLVALGALRLRQGRLVEAEQLLQSAIESDPRSYLGHYYRGQLLSEQGKYQEAVSAFQEATSLRPDAGWIYGELSLAYLHLGLHKEADESFRKALALDPKNQYLLHRRAYTNLRMERGMQAAAAALAYITRQGWSDRHTPYIALVAYFGYRQAGRKDSANSMLKEALAKVGDSEWVHTILSYLQTNRCHPPYNVIKVYRYILDEGEWHAS